MPEAKFRLIGLFVARIVAYEAPSGEFSVEEEIFGMTKISVLGRLLSLGVMALFFRSEASFASESCAKIEDSLERLYCYDSVYRNESSKNSDNVSTKEAFAALLESTRYDGDEGFLFHGIENCRLYRHRFEYVVSKGPRKVGHVWQLLVDLSEVDIGKTK